MGAKADRPGCREGVGFKLAQQLRDNGHDLQVAERVMREYAAAVPVGDHLYEASEAISSLRSAYSKPAREPWGDEGDGTPYEPPEPVEETPPPAVEVVVTEPEPEPPQRPVLGEKAYHGLAGRIVRTIEPESEADPAALLIQLLVAVGNMIDRGVGFTVGATEHYTVLNAMIVGPTSAGAKGTALGEVQRVCQIADPIWAENCIAPGSMSSGEGVLMVVRDPIVTRRKPKNDKERAEVDDDGFIEEVTDPGTKEKRCLCIETELGGVLEKMKREGNSLSSTFRQFYDCSRIVGTLVKKDRLKATEPHVSVIGHITPSELAGRLADGETHNGWANRWLYALVQASKELPFGGNVPLDQLDALGRELRDAVAAAPKRGSAAMLGLDEAARGLWECEYRRLRDGHPGRWGVVRNRARPNVLRLAVIYAVLDQTNELRVEHLEAALAVWDYCDQSARVLFGDSTGSRVGDEIMLLLREAGAAGIARGRLVAHFKGHLYGADLDKELNRLEQDGLARSEKRRTGGRPAVVWFAC